MSLVNPKPVSSPALVSLRLGRRLVQGIYVCFKATQMYDVSNVAVQGASADLVDTIRTLCRLDGQVQLALVSEMLVLNGNRLRPDMAGAGSFHYLLEQMASHRMGVIVFDESVTPRDVVAFCDAVNRCSRDAEDCYQVLLARLGEVGVSGVRIEQMQDLPADVDDQLLQKNLKQRSVESFFKSIEMTRRVLSAGDPAKIDFKRAKRVVQNMVDAISEQDFILLSLASIKNYDQYTFNHSTNVAIYSITFGQRLGLDRPTLASLGMSGLFHDLGKTRVPKEILNKTTLLEAHEWEAMKAHSVLGAEILLKSRRLNDAVVRNILVAFEHHLNADLGGYPRLSDHRDLNLFSKIVAIADCYDALTTPRVYRNLSYTPQEALSIMMEGRGSVYDPELLKVFINTIGIHPIGSVVELSSGETAVVYCSNPQQNDKPTVRVFADAAGTKVPERLEDLSLETPGRAPLEIARTIDPGSYFESIEDYLGIL
jgi:HD-GYP domain-containing protein (c-di-GMP phosphodiesterase class II)